jgi:hypothetical protein
MHKLELNEQISAHFIRIPMIKILKRLRRYFNVF